MCKIAAIGIIGTVLSAVLRKQTPELSLLLALCAGVGVLSLIIDALMVVLEFLRELAQMAEITDELLQPVIKTVAISILTKLTVEVCRSGGESGLAVFIEVCAVILELCVSIPLIRGVAVLMGAILG